MSVEYRHYLIPRDNRFRPPSKDLVVLAQCLIDEGWVGGPNLVGGLRIRTQETGSEAICRFSEAQLAALEHVEYMLAGRDCGRQCPLEPGLPGGPENAEYDLQIHLSDDYVCPVSQCCEAADPIVCAHCGADILYELANDRLFSCYQRVHRLCPRCGIAVDPSQWSVIVTNAANGERRTHRVGLAYRFALVIDLGGDLRLLSANTHMDRVLVSLCERTLEIQFMEVEHGP